MLLFGVSANLDYYRLTHEKDGVPTARVRTLAFVFMLLFGWIEILAWPYFVNHDSKSLARPATPFPRIQPGESGRISSSTVQTQKDALKRKGGVKNCENLAVNDLARHNHGSLRRRTLR